MELQMYWPDVPRLVVIFRRVELADVISATEALLSAGVRAFEVTFDGTPRAEALAPLVELVGSRGLVGVGTVFTTEQVSFAAGAGARFVVSPHTDPVVIEATKKEGLLAVPGALTPTEIATAMAAGADIVKLFPIAAVGGADYVQFLRGPLPDVPFIATGGVTAEMARLCARANCGVALGVGLIDPAAVERRDWQSLANSASSFLRAVELGAPAERVGRK